jgi:hypothetical protein
MAVAVLKQFGRGTSDSLTARNFEVVVLDTTIQGTLSSLKRAAELAEGLGARIRLLVPTEVPYPLDLNSPAVPLGFAKRRFATIASQSRVDTFVDIRIGRDKMRMIEEALDPGSLVVIDQRRWPSTHWRIAKRLERMGHHVVFSN